MPDFKCPQCGHERALSDRVVGHAYRCPGCNAKIKHHRDGRLEVLELGTLQPAGSPPDPIPAPKTPDQTPLPLPQGGLSDSKGPAAAAEGNSPHAMAGRVLGNYRLISLIGTGGYSHVYLAEQQILKRKVAVKVLSPRLAATPEQATRMTAEAVSLAKVDHLNVVRVYDYGEEKGTPYLAMEYVNGQSLEGLILSQGKLTPERTVELALEVLNGLGALHQAGLLHRDIKPGNILIPHEGPIKLADFGLVREISENAEGRSRTFVGTAEYAAPELAVGCPPDAGSDLYALGATLYKALTGKPPFSGGNPTEILRSQLYEPIVPPGFYNKDIPPALENLLLRLLHKERGQRPATCEETIRLLQQLKQVRSKPIPKARPRAPVALRNRDAPLKLVAISCILGMAVWLWFLMDGRKKDEARAAAALKTNLERTLPASVEEEPREPREVRKPAVVEVLPPASSRQKIEAEAEPKAFVASVLQFNTGDLVEGSVARTRDGFEILIRGKSRTVDAREVRKWFRTAREMALDGETWFLEGSRLYTLAQRSGVHTPPARAAILKSALERAELAREWFVSTKQHFPAADVWLESQIGLSNDLVRRIVGTQTEKPSAPVAVPPAATPVPAPVGRPLDRTLLAGLNWLARHQEPNGSWQVTRHMDRCRKSTQYASSPICSPNPGHDDFDTGVTGLALLAFLSAGYSHLSDDTYEGISFGDVVRKANQWILARQEADGCVGSRNAQKYMYNHAICTAVLCEMYLLAGSNTAKAAAQKAVDFLIASQNPGKAWRYHYRCGDNDMSVTGWAVMALRSAELAGLSFPRSAYKGVLSWMDESTDESSGRAGYTHKGTGRVFIPGLNEQFDHHETMSAIGVMSRIFIGQKKSDSRLSAGCELLMRDLPRWDGNSIDFYYWYYASLALFQFDGPSGPKWRTWNEALKSALVKNQNTASSSCRSGSWETYERWSVEGGRVYTTALALLALKHSGLDKPVPRPEARIQDASATDFKWNFHLRSGGLLRVISYEEDGENYLLKVSGGTTRVSKESVEKIEAIPKR